VNKDIKLYLDNERALSRYNIKILSIKNNSEAHRRLICIEEEFLSIPFESMGFATLDEVKKAISTYRESRNLFYKKYEILLSSEDIKMIDLKLNFFKNLQKYFMLCIQQYSNFDPMIPLKYKKNGAYEKKIKALIQALFMSLKIYVEEKYKILSNKERDRYLSFEIDKIISSLDQNIFKYFLESKMLLSQYNDMVNIKYLNKTCDATNIISIYNDSHECVYGCKSNEKIDLSIPTISPLYLGYKNIIKRTLDIDKKNNEKNNVFGILFPMIRSGNEKCSLLYKEIYFNKTDISELFENKISNIKVTKDNKEVYYKGLYMVPLWRAFYIAKNNPVYFDFLKYLLDIDDDSSLENLDNKKYKNIYIDKDSTILISMTRTEDNSFSSALDEVLKRVDEIKYEYNNRET
jgi:hypothetical protein